jgi:hypothetical protein
VLNGMKGIEKQMKKQSEADYAIVREASRYTAAMMAPLAKILKEGRDEREVEEARARLIAQLRERRALVKQPALRNGRPTPRRPPGSTRIVVTAPYDFTWTYQDATGSGVDAPSPEVSSSATRSGSMMATALARWTDPFHGFAEAYAGIGNFIEVPADSNQTWMCMPDMNWTASSALLPGDFGGAQVSGIFGCCLQTYQNGKMIQQDIAGGGTTTLWSQSGGVFGNPSWVFPSGTDFAPRFGFGPLSGGPGLTYVFWVWFGVSGSCGATAVADGNIQALVNEMLFETID